MKKSTLLVALAAGVVLNASAAESRLNISNVKAEKIAATSVITAQSDAVKVANLKSNRSTNVSTRAAGDVVAKYNEPKGLYTIGLASGGSGFGYAFRYGAAYKEMTWTNASTGADSYVWSFQDPNFTDKENPFLTTNDVDLTTVYPWCFIDGPILTAKAGTASDTYDRQDQIAYTFGGDTDISGDGTLFGVTTYGSPYYKNSLGYGYTSTYVASYDVSGEEPEAYTTEGTFTSWVESLTEDYGLAKTDKVITKSFVNVFPKPSATISVSKVWMWATVTVANATTLKVEIVKVDDDNKLTDEIIAYGTANVSSKGASWLEFDLYTVDEDEFETYGRVNIDSSFAVRLTGFADNEDVLSVSPVLGNGSVYDRAVEEFNYEIHAYMEFDVVRGGEVIGTLLEYSPWIFYVDKANLPTTFFALTDYMFMLDAECWWLEGEEASYEFPVTGGTHDFAFYGYYEDGYLNPDGEEYNWTIEPADATQDLGWLEAGIQNVMNPDTKKYTGKTIITFTADALPEGVSGRKADLIISYPGASTTLTLIQGVAGVKDVTVKSSQYVTVDGNNFVVKATSDVTKAEVYTVAGVKVAEAAVNGATTIDAAGLAHGVYFVKFNNGKAVKVVK